MPGKVYYLIGEFLGEKLPLLVFTNRTSFKVCLTYQINVYNGYLEQARAQQRQFERICIQIPSQRSQIAQEINEIKEIITVYEKINSNLVQYLEIVLD